ncbi:MAG: hypothetical protein M3N24_07050 [Actinomycetota bacterium]|nr:hypothetical protein [Actinomycetota bacterium]
MNEDEKDQPAMGPDDPTVEADEADPTTPGPGDSDADPPPTGEEPDEDEVVRPD